MALTRHNIQAALEAIGESDTLIAGHLETVLKATLSWDDATIQVASTDRFPNETTIAIDGEEIEVSVGGPTLLLIDDRPDVLPSTPDIGIGARVVDVGRLYSDLDIARAQMLLNTATGPWLSRIAENHGVGIPSFRGKTLFLDDDRFREYLKITCYLQAGPRFGIMRVLQAVFPPMILTGSTDPANPTRITFTGPVLPVGLRRSLVRINEDWSQVYRIQNIDPAGWWVDLWPVAGPTWAAADFDANPYPPGIEVELFMWDVWEEPHDPGRFYIDLYELNLTGFPWGSTYLQGGEERVSSTRDEVITRFPINQVIGVYLATDTLRTGTNYFTGGSYAGNLITLGTSLPSPGTAVIVDYGYIDPSTAQLLEDILSENEPPGTYWPFYLTDVGAILKVSGILEIIRAMGMLPVISSSILGDAVGAPLEEDLPVLASGLSFSRPSSDVVRLTPIGVGDKAYIWVHDGVGGWVYVEVDTDLDCDLTTSGAGGLDTGSQAADTGYQIFLIAKGDLAAGLREPKLIAKVNGASIDPVLPSGYTHWSKPISFASVDVSTNIVDFEQFGDRYYYKLHRGVQVQTTYQAAADSNTDCSKAVPYFATEMDVFLVADNGDSGTANPARLEDQNNYVRWLENLTNDTTEPEAKDANVVIPVPHTRGTQPEINVGWSGAISSGGIQAWIESFRLFLE
jgi:hypothetical protein